MNAKTLTRKNDTGTEDSTAFLKNIFRGELLTLIVYLLLLSAMTLAAYCTKDPAALLPYMGFGVSMLTGFLSGYFTARKNGSAGIFSGLVGGAIYLFLLWLISLLFDSTMPTGRRLLCSGIALSLAVLGGYMGTHKKEKTRKSKRRK